MYKKVVVPLDGSKLAEVAIPHLEEIAKGCTIPEVMLVSVTERLSGAVTRLAAAPELPSGWSGQPTGVKPVGAAFSGIVYTVDLPHPREVPAEMGKMARTAWNNLVRKADGLAKKGLSVQAYVLVGNPAEEIINFAKEQAVDLIIMGSRGKSGFNQWDMGNVADKVIRRTDIPVVLVKPKPGFKETKPKRRGRPN